MPKYRTEGKYILDAHGDPQPCDDLFDWALWYETADRQIALDRIGTNGEAVTVSTIFLALDYRVFRLPGDQRPPLLFETMVFGGPLDLDRQRYATRVEALAGHAEMCLRVREAKRGG